MNVKRNALKKLFISHKFDILLCFVLIIIATGLFFIFRNSGKKGAYVVVRQGTKEVAEIPLNINSEHEYETLYGKNTLVIEDGYAYIKDASCKDHICEKTGKISKVGQTIICLPNELFIKIVSDKEGEFDAIVQ